MRFMVGLVIGLAVGWGIGFLRQWRRRDGRSPERLDDVEVENRLLSKMSKMSLDPSGVRQRLAEVEDALSSDVEDVSGPPGVRGTRSNQIPQRKDRLERIKGIGAVFARRFNDAGIFTFDQLAALTPEQVEEIVQVERWQKIEPEQWIAEAQALAQEVS